MRKRPRANSLAYRPWGPSPTLAGESGGGERDRTDDPLLAKQVLSQLSYSPDPFALQSRPSHPGRDVGGSGWIRTIDPRLIKTVL